MSKELWQAREFCLAVFNSSQAAMRSEKLLEEAGLDYITIPTPRAITSNCGLSLKFHCSDQAKLLKLLETSGVAHHKIYRTGAQGTFDLVE